MQSALRVRRFPTAIGRWFNRSKGSNGRCSSTPGIREIVTKDGIGRWPMSLSGLVAWAGLAHEFQRRLAAGGGRREPRLRLIGGPPMPPPPMPPPSMCCLHAGRHACETGSDKPHSPVLPFFQRNGNLANNPGASRRGAGAAIRSPHEYAFLNVVAATRDDSLLLGVLVLRGNAAEFLSASWVPQQDRAVLVHVPEGTKRLRLQTRASATAAWELVGIVHLEGRAGTLKMRLPDGVALENVLLETSATDPFPYAFYQGQNSFRGKLPHPAREDFAARARWPSTHSPDDADATPRHARRWSRNRTSGNGGDGRCTISIRMRGLQVFDLSDFENPRRVRRVADARGRRGHVFDRRRARRFARQSL